MHVLSELALIHIQEEAKDMNLSYWCDADLLAAKAFPDWTTMTEERWNELSVEGMTQDQQTAWLFWDWTSKPGNNVKPAYVKTADGNKTALAVQTFGPDELPGGNRALQQWSQKNEYTLSQCKMELKKLHREKKGSTAAPHFH